MRQFRATAGGRVQRVGYREHVYNETFDEIEEKIAQLEALTLAQLIDDHTENIAICVSIPVLAAPLQ